MAITAAMPGGTGLDRFQKKFPERHLRCRHRRTACGHLRRRPGGRGPGRRSARSIPPSCSAPTTRWCTTSCLQNLPVRFAIDRAGLGRRRRRHPRRQFRPQLPGLPARAWSSWRRPTKPSWCTWSRPPHRWATGPSAIRYPRGEGTGIALPARGEILPLGRGRVLREGSRVAIVSLGTRLAEAMRAADELAARGHSTTVADARFAKPIDTALLDQLARRPRSA